MLIPMEHPHPQPLSFRTPKQGHSHPGPCCITQEPGWPGGRQRRLGMVLPLPACVLGEAPRLRFKKDCSVSSIEVPYSAAGPKTGTSW